MLSIGKNILTSRDNEYKIAGYLLNHWEGMSDDIKNRKVYCPPLLIPEYRSALVNEVTFILAEALGLPYEIVAEIVTDEFLTGLLGKEFCEG